MPGVKTSDPKTNGCPADRDGDGVIDKEDACPDVPGVKTSDPKTNGCPPVNPDRDGDGIPFQADACPDVAGPANPDPTKNGCPLARVEGGQIKITEQVKFAEGSARLLKDSDGVLNAVLELLNKHPEIAKLKIEGHTDNKGQAAFNKTLSGQRAGSGAGVAGAAQGRRGAALESAGYGADRPIDSNGTGRGAPEQPACRVPHRRQGRRAGRNAASRHRQHWRSPDSRRASASRSFRSASRSFSARVLRESVSS